MEDTGEAHELVLVAVDSSSVGSSKLDGVTDGSFIAKERVGSVELDKVEGKEDWLVGEITSP